jgi:SEC-C motif-containing protein
MGCYCCSGKPFDQCCGPLLDGTRQAASPEELMRSRYSAYAAKNFDYIVDTIDPQRRYDFNHEATRDWMNSSAFTGLEVLNASEDGNKGEVEFIARFRQHGGVQQQHHERSRFRKQAGRWYYRDGKVVT